MKSATACILIDGEEKQKLDYIEKCQQLGDVIIAKDPSHLLRSLINGKYVIVDLNIIKHSIGVITDISKYHGAETIGISFGGSAKLGQYFNKFILVP